MFFLGVVVGIAICGCFAVLLIPRKRQQPVVWTDEHYQKPAVTTHILIRERNVEL